MKLSKVILENKKVVSTDGKSALTMASKFEPLPDENIAILKFLAI